MVVDGDRTKGESWIAVISVIVLFSLGSAAFGDGGLAVGYAELDITPELGTGMPGYFHGRKADGILDPLLIKALALTFDDATVVIVAIDLIGFDRSLVDKMRGAIEAEAGISSESVFIHATHTHTGARVSEIAGKLPGQTASAVAKAMANRKGETDVRLGWAEERAVTFIRRYLMKDGTIRTNPGRSNRNIVRPIGQIDAKVNVLSFHDRKICLVSHGLHCDCVSGSKFSADYPYHLTEGIREELGSNWNVVYLNACSGNINHINVNDKDQRSSYQESRKIGRTLAKAALRAHKRSDEVKIKRVNSRVTEIKCPIRKVPKEVYEWAKAEMQKDSNKASKRNFNELTPTGIIRLAETKEKHRAAEIIALNIGPVGIVGLPAECFVELSQDIQVHSLMDSTWVIGLTGGSMGYVPHRRGYEEGGYEATYSSARLGPETPGLWCDAAIEMLKDLKGEEQDEDEASKKPPTAEVTISQEDKAGTVYSGTVTDLDGNAIEGAKLYILGYYRRFKAVSGQEGEYEMPWDVSKVPEPHGDIWIIARHEEKNLAAATKVGPETQRQNVTLLPAVTATGTITDADGKAIENGTVYFGFSAARGVPSFADRYRFAADSRGVYRVPFIPVKNRYSVGFHAEGYGSKRISVNTDDAVDGVLELGRAVLGKADERISGVVVGPDGKGVANVQVFRKSTGQPVGYEKTDADGRFTLNVCKGDVTLSAIVIRDGVPWVGRAKVASGTEDVKIVVEPR